MQGQAVVKGGGGDLPYFGGMCFSVLKLNAPLQFSYLPWRELALYLKQIFLFVLEFWVGQAVCEFAVISQED